MINLSELWQAIEGRVVALIHKTEARGCRVISTSTQTLESGGSGEALSFDTEIYDTDGCWAVGSPTRLTAQREGYYLAGGGWAHDTNTATAYRTTAAIVKNGTTTLVTVHALTGTDANFYLAPVTGMFWMSEGDYIEIFAYQNSGGDKTILAASTTNQQYFHGWLMRIS